MNPFQAKFFYEMLGNQWQSYSKLQKIQNIKLQKLIHHAYYNIPFYRHLFDSTGLKPEEIKDIEDLRNIPITSKKQLQSVSIDDILYKDSNLSNYERIATSGSTGLPLQLFYLKEDFSILNMNWMRPLWIYGVRPWHKQLEITGPHNVLDKKKWYHHFGLWRKKRTSIFKNPEEWIKLWYQYKPDVLYGYSGSLKLLAKKVIEKGLSDLNPRFIFGVSDLVDEECRELILKAFKKRLVDLYGAAETGCIAWECHVCNAYHINMDTVIVEFIKDNKPAAPGTQGRIVVTNLHSHAMPIIRYDLGDMATLLKEKSTCGRELPLLKMIEGRADAFIILPSGKMLSPLFFFGIMKPVKGIKQWKIWQKDKKNVHIIIVPAENFTQDTINQIRTRIKKHIDSKIVFNFNLVKTIPQDSTGKVRAVVSEVKSQI